MTDKLKKNNLEQFEILAVVLSAILKFIFVDWLDWRAFYITGICLCWLGYIFYRINTKEGTLSLWGFKKEGFKQTVFILAPFIFLSIIASILYSNLNNKLFFTWQIIPIFFLYPLWGIIQQLLILGIFSHNLVSVLEIKINRYVIIFLISGLFSLIHYPDFLLMGFTFIMELVFITVYLKWRNLLPIGIAHGWIATFLLYYVMERNLWAELFSRF